MADFQDEEGVEQFGASKRIVDRESDYSKRRLNRSVAGDASTYAERVKEAQLEREKDNTMKQIAQKRREEAERAAADARLAAARGDDAEKDALPSAPSEEPAAKRAKPAEVEWEDMPVAADAPPQPNPRGATAGTRRPSRVTSARLAATADRGTPPRRLMRAAAGWGRRPSARARGGTRPR